MGQPDRRGSWELSDDFWARIKPLIPERRRDPRGRGRPPVPPRQVFAALLYILRTGIQWKALPRSMGSGSTVHRRFQEWERQGLFVAIWQAGLAEYDEMVGIAWSWQSLDGAMTKAPLGGDETGPNPTDRVKKRHEASRLGRRPWGPALDRRQRRQSA
jgi:transposase